MAADIAYVENRPGPVWRHWRVGGIARSEHNFAWEPILNMSGLNVFAQTLGYWSVSLNVQRMFSSYDDRLTRGGPLAIRPQQVAVYASLSSDGRQPVTVGVTGAWEDQPFGGWTRELGLRLGIKTSTRWNLTAGPRVERLSRPAQYVVTLDDPAYAPTFGRRYVFAPLEQSSVGLETRLNVTFSPSLSLETYVQPLLSSADYGAPVQLVAPRTYVFEPYQDEAGAAPDRSFNLRSLRGNAVLRWEWREGSTIYVAWQQSRTARRDFGDFDFGRDHRALMRTRPDNIVLVKVNYWLNP